MKDLLLDNGAYTSWGATTPTVMMMPSTSLYRVPNVRFQAACVYTNNTYCQAMRGYGTPQVTFAIESNLDELAEKAGIDGYEFRLRNANVAGEVTPQGFRPNSCGHQSTTSQYRSSREAQGFCSNQGFDFSRTSVGILNIFGFKD